MVQNFIGVDRDQVFLMPPSLRDWLAEDHLVWTVLESDGEMDLTRFMRHIGQTGTVARRMTRR